MSLNNLSKKDYMEILHFYKIPIPTNIEEIREKVEGVMGKKMCKCIKKVGGPNYKQGEARAIGICTRSIFKNKGLHRGKITCKNKPRVEMKKKKKKTKRKTKKKTKRKTKRTK